MLTAAACGGGSGGSDSATADFKFGMILVGAQNDHGWSQAHYEAGRYVLEQLRLPSDALIVEDNVNPADRPGTSIESVVDDMVGRGARLIFATSDDMKDGIEAAAAAHPDISFIWSSGDSAWPQGESYRADLTNLGNIMGHMEYGKMIAGCAAALTTHSGRIGYLGPLINDETRRLSNSAYLGARYCYAHYRGQDPAALHFEVEWIGFWFNIPGVTRNPTQVTDELFDAGADVVISGLDTTEALADAAAVTDAGQPVGGATTSMGVAAPRCARRAFLGWGPATRCSAGGDDAQFTATWRWLGRIGPHQRPTPQRGRLATGARTVRRGKADVDEFIAALGAGDVQLYVGPLNWQDGSSFLADGEHASDVQIWYAEHLLNGIVGTSTAAL